MDSKTVDSKTVDSKTVGNGTTGNGNAGGNTRGGSPGEDQTLPDDEAVMDCRPGEDARFENLLGREPSPRFLSAIGASSGEEFPPIDLGEAALAACLMIHPDLDVDAYLARLDAMATVLSTRMEGCSASEKITILNDYLFRELEFEGDSHTYEDPANNYLSEVLDRRLGVPITLSILYLEVARRVGIDAEGISFPAHFLVRVEVGSTLLVVDPFHDGISLSPTQLAERLAQILGTEEIPVSAVNRWLEAADEQTILLRMLRNLKVHYIQSKQPAMALTVINHMLALSQRLPVEHRDRGILFQQADYFKGALQEFIHYLDITPTASDAYQIRSRVAVLERTLSRLN